MMVITIHWLHYGSSISSQIFSVWDPFIFYLSHFLVASFAPVRILFIRVFGESCVLLSLFMSFEIRIFCSQMFINHIVHRSKVLYYYSLLSLNHTKHKNLPNFFALHVSPVLCFTEVFNVLNHFSFLQTTQNNTVSARFMLKAFTPFQQNSKLIRMNVECWSVNGCTMCTWFQYYTYSLHLLCVILFKWRIDIDITHWYHKRVWKYSLYGRQWNYFHANKFL